MESSIFQPHSQDDPFKTPPTRESFRVDWKNLGYRYYPLYLHLKHRFGGRVQKISLDGGFTCPNVDGTVTKGGCTFCDNRAFSPSRRVKREVIQLQIQRGIERLQRRYENEMFLAYYQPATNTYGPLEKLRTLWETALEDPRVVGLVIGTRPDCIPDEVLDLIDEFAARTYVSLELGVQTIHNASLEWMNRGHLNDVSDQAMQRVQGRRFEIGLHIILGLPGESHAMMMETATQVARWNPHSVKLHNLYAVHRTKLADQLAAGEVRMLEMEEYIELVADFLEQLPPSMVIERIIGDAPPKNLIAPQWCLRKGDVQKALRETLERRQSFQGSKYSN
ncbi:MAG: TIGR01212 family radical SAM protein [Planctomycetales bacterium]|nr:TIGR01212 family radical SAM protein [Planctomycetales bacterium]